jgi:uncharacterized protein YhaN
MNESHWLLAAGSLIGSLVTAFMGGIVMILNAWNNNKQKERATKFALRQKKRASKFGEQELIINRQEKHIARVEAQMEEQQKAIERIQRQNTELREDQAELRMYHALLYDYARRQYATLKDAGLAAEPPPELPVLRKRDGTDAGTDAEFEAKTTAQNTTLLAKEGEKLRAEPPGGSHAEARPGP